MRGTRQCVSGCLCTDGDSGDPEPCVGAGSAAVCGSEVSAGVTQAGGKYLHGSELRESVDCAWEDACPLRVHMCECKRVCMSEAGGSVISTACKER